jgi:hypothetical protein
MKRGAEEQRAEECRKKKRVARCLFVSLRGWDERFKTLTPAFGPHISTVYIRTTSIYEVSELRTARHYLLEPLEQPSDTNQAEAAAN